MNKMLIPVIGLLLVSTGCATLFGKKSDNITIHSNDPAAAIMINGIEVGHGSATYNLPRDKTAIITTHKRGCSDAFIQTGQEINNTTFLNTICLLCYLIDAATGDIHEAAPLDYTVNPNCRE